jgi:hypothetical protein
MTSQEVGAVFGSYVERNLQHGLKVAGSIPRFTREAFDTSSEAEFTYKIFISGNKS